MVTPVRLSSSLRSAHDFDVKPPGWGGFSPALVAPEWQWFWANDEGTWPLWERGGNTAYDLSPFKRNATLTGANTVWASSNLGPVVHSSGASDHYLNLGSASQFPMGATSGQPFTVGGLITHPSAPNGTAFGYFDGTRAFQFQVLAVESKWRILYGISPFDEIKGDSLTTNIARTYIFTFSSSGVGKMYIDGNLIGQDTSPTGDFSATSQNFLVGARGAGGGADGEDEVFIHAFFFRSTEWSQQQVRLWDAAPFGPFRMHDVRAK